jgi:hypothetical protein
MDFYVVNPEYDSPMATLDSLQLPSLPPSVLTNFKPEILHCILE